MAERGSLASQYSKETPSAYAILKFKESILSEIRTFEEERATVLKNQPTACTHDWNM